MHSCWWVAQACFQPPQKLPDFTLQCTGRLAGPPAYLKSGRVCCLGQHEWLACCVVHRVGSFARVQVSSCLYNLSAVFHVAPALQLLMLVHHALFVLSLQVWKLPKGLDERDVSILSSSGGGTTRACSGGGGQAGASRLVSCDTRHGEGQRRHGMQYMATYKHINLHRIPSVTAHLYSMRLRPCPVETAQGCNVFPMATRRGVVTWQC